MHILQNTAGDRFDSKYTVFYKLGVIIIIPLFGITFILNRAGVSGLVNILKTGCQECQFLIHLLRKYILECGLKALPARL